VKLVTGATGFVGPKIVQALRDQDQPVRCLVRSRGKAQNLEALGCDLVEGDMTDAASLRAAAEGCDAVVHLVAIRQGREEQFRRVMEQGTRDLVAASEAAGVRRLVLMSALGTSEETKDLVPYYHAKWEAEQAVSASKLEHVIFRPSFIFGRDGGILPTFRRLAKVAPVTPVIGSGKQRIQPIWIDDVAAYFAAAIDNSAADALMAGVTPLM
jgi:NADH dehydrogenase